MTPLVSVIVPVYNRETMLLDSLECVRAQSWRPLELIVVDDGSTDATPEVLERWMREVGGAENFSARVIRQDNRGAQVARNRGFDESRGEFIQFMDSDHIIHPQKIELQVGALRNRHDAAAATCEWLHGEEFPAMTPLTTDPAVQTIDLPREYYRIHWDTHPLLFRRATCEAIGPWDETLRIRQDLNYNVRFACMGRPLALVRATMAFVPWHEGPRISTGNFHYEATTQALDRARAATEERGWLSLAARNLIAMHYYKNFRWLARKEQPELAHASLRKAAALRPTGKAAAFVAMARALSSLMGSTLADRALTQLSGGLRTSRGRG